MTGYQPDFDVDKARGEEAEVIYRELRTMMLNGTAEVKHDFRAHETGNVYVEHECMRAVGWRPSGIAATKASTWVIRCWPNLILVAPTWVVRQMHNDALGEGRTASCNDGTHPTRGALIPLREFNERVLRLQTAPAVAAAAA